MVANSNIDGMSGIIPSKFEEDPYQTFMYALKAPETRRQYPRRLEYFFDFLALKGDIREKCLTLYNLAKNDNNWIQFQLMQYIDYQKERIEIL